MNYRKDSDDGNNNVSSTTGHVVNYISNSIRTVVQNNIQSYVSIRVGDEYTVKYGTGVWLILILIRSIFPRPNNK